MMLLKSGVLIVNASKIATHKPCAKTNFLRHCLWSCLYQPTRKAVECLFLKENQMDMPHYEFHFFGRLVCFVEFLIFLKHMWVFLTGWLWPREEGRHLCTHCRLICKLPWSALKIMRWNCGPSRWQSSSWIGIVISSTCVEQFVVWIERICSIW